jgi:hypothetical protein
VTPVIQSPRPILRGFEEGDRDACAAMQADAMW